MKNIYLILFAIAFLSVSCHDEPDWLGDNTTTEGRHFPVISTLEVDQTFVSSGDVVEVDVRFWSIDPIMETQLIEKADGASDFSIVQTVPYSFNFNEETQNEQLILNYTAPAVSDTTVYEIGARIVNENGLERVSTETITIIP